MNKVVIFFGLSLFAAVSLLAQGRVNFTNGSPTPITITSWWPGNPATPYVTNILGTASTAAFGFGPASVRIQLFAGLTSSSLSPVLIGSAGNLNYSVTNTASAVAGAQGTFNGGVNLVLPFPFDGSVPVYLHYNIIVINGHHYYHSPIIQVNLATGLAPATQLFSATPNANQWGGPMMIPMPEPSALTLLGMGASALFFARRRK